MGRRKHVWLVRNPLVSWGHYLRDKTRRVERGEGPRFVELEVRTEDGRRLLLPLSVAEAGKLSAELAAQADELEAMRKGEPGGVCFTPECDDTAKWAPITSTMEAEESSGKARCDWCRATIRKVALPARDGVDYLRVADQWTQVLRMSKAELRRALPAGREAA